MDFCRQRNRAENRAEWSYPGSRWGGVEINDLWMGVNGRAARIFLLLGFQSIEDVATTSHHLIKQPCLVWMENNRWIQVKHVNV